MRNDASTEAAKRGKSALEKKRVLRILQGAFGDTELPARGGEKI